MAQVRQRRRAQRVPEREVVILHGEDVREVGAELDPQVELDRFHALVHDRDRVLHPVPDEPLPADRQRVLRQTFRQRVPHEERRGEVLDPVGREQQRTLAVHGQLQHRQEPRVLGVQAFHVAPEIAELVADAEGRAFEDAQAIRHQLRRMRPPDDCASALTTSSSTLTCGGRVTAKSTHSAMSCGRIAPTPS